MTKQKILRLVQMAEKNDESPEYRSLLNEFYNADQQKMKRTVLEMRREQALKAGVMVPK